MRRFTRCPRLEARAPRGMPIQLVVARGRVARLLGLAGVAQPQPGVGLLIPRCRSVHTLGVQFPIDVAFLEWPPSAGASRVLDVREALAPSRVATLRGVRGVAALELRAAEAVRLGLLPGAAVTLDATCRGPPPAP